MSLTYGSLCSGYGGLEMGVQSILGGETLWHVEFDTAPSKILAHHWPGVPNYGDLTTTDWHSVPRVDVITAGFPCQPFSHAGKRLGANDERHLWPHIAKAIDILRPRLVVLENVRGLLSGQGEPDPEWVADLDAKAKHWQAVIHHTIEPKIRNARNRGQLDRIARLEADAVRLLEQRRVAMDTVRRARARLVRAIGAVARDLALIGYSLRWYGLRAADVGLAHGRFRVFLFATPADADHSGWGEHGWPVAVRAEQPATECAGDDAPDGLTLLPTPAVNDMGAAYTPEEWDAWTERMKSAHGNGNGHGKSLSIEAQRLLPTPRTSDTNGAGAHGTGGPDLRTVAALLPTPRATDGTKGGPNQRGSSGDLMPPSAVAGLGKHDGPNCGEPTRADVFAGIYCACERNLLPTPRATRGGSSSEIRDLLLPTPTSSVDSGGLDENGEKYGPTSGVTLTDAAIRQDWREYEAAIRRHEHATGRTAPPPTETGPKGKPRLSPAFVEWLMALPEGWVTDVPGISRNDQLKALGNGVVPAQCAAALRAFIHDTRQEAVA